MSQWPRQRDMNAFYYNPDANRDGVADATWARDNLVRIVPPYPLWYPSDAGGRLNKRATPFKALTVHRKCADSLTRVLTRIGKEISAEDIRRFELDICGGAYVFRLMRNGRALSIHSWGAAIDLSHLINRYKRRYDAASGMMPATVVKMFEAEGWTWGGLWSTGDAMHFQAADI